MVLVGGGFFFFLLVVLVVGAEAAVPMELYFSPAELARIAGYGEEAVSSVLVSGQLACELRLPVAASDDSDSDVVLSFELPGAMVAITCGTEGPSTTTTGSLLATTDEHGNFTVHLPSVLHAIPNLEKACAVKVLQLPPEYSTCTLPSSSSSYGLRLTSSEDGTRIYTTGVIRLQHTERLDDRQAPKETRSL